MELVSLSKVKRSLKRLLIRLIKTLGNSYKIVRDKNNETRVAKTYGIYTYFLAKGSNDKILRTTIDLKNRVVRIVIKDMKLQEIIKENFGDEIAGIKTQYLNGTYEEPPSSR